MYICMYLPFSAVHRGTNVNHVGVFASIYIYLFVFRERTRGSVGATTPETCTTPRPSETGEVCVPEASVGNRCFRRRAELDRRACTRSCSSDTDSRCRLHWSRLTGRDYYKGGWRDVRIYSGQGMRRTCMLLCNPASQPERERFFLILLPFFLLDLFSPTLSPRLRYSIRSFHLSFKTDLPSISSVYTTEIPWRVIRCSPSTNPYPVDRLKPPSCWYLRIVNNEIDRIIGATFQIHRFYNVFANKGCFV